MVSAGNSSNLKLIEFETGLKKLIEFKLIEDDLRIPKDPFGTLEMPNAWPIKQGRPKPPDNINII